MKNFIEIKNILLIFFILIVIISFIFITNISPNNNDSLFIVHNNETSITVLADRLYAGSFISSKWLFKSIFSVAGAHQIEPGGYVFKKGTDLFKIIDIFSEKPDFIWIYISEGLRKEEIADILVANLNWGEDDKMNFINFYTSGEYKEGVYFPETYLIPNKIGGEDMAKKMINKFNEEMQPLMAEFNKQNIKWTTGLKLASIIQREAASEDEMNLIAGILWNRLLIGMRLQTDATLQYMTGEKDGKWWEPILIEDKKIDSPYNTYKYEGLPPTPISNPGIVAIQAILKPRKTSCIYYIHANRQIHCSDNYDDHMDKINKYLKN